MVYLTVRYFFMFQTYDYPLDFRKMDLLSEQIFFSIRKTCPFLCFLAELSQKHLEDFLAVDSIKRIRFNWFTEERPDHNRWL